MALAVQQVHMRAVWPGLQTNIERSLLTVRGVVQPTPVTRSYKIRLTYRLGGAPHLHVLEPKLERRPEEPETPIPHTYLFATPGQERPCVYYPPSGEWTSAKPLATTVMPWLLSWLVDYEVWFATGEWLGGGIPHGSTKRPEEMQQAGEDATWPS